MDAVINYVMIHFSDHGYYFLNVLIPVINSESSFDQRLLTLFKFFYGLLLFVFIIYFCLKKKKYYYSLLQSVFGRLIANLEISSYVL